MELPSKYRFSQGVGLSYKFSSAKVLEKNDVEKQEQNNFSFVPWAEFEEAKEGQPIVSIEYW